MGTGSGSEAGLCSLPLEVIDWVMMKSVLGSFIPDSGAATDVDVSDRFAFSSFSPDEVPRWFPITSALAESSLTSISSSKISAPSIAIRIETAFLQLTEGGGTWSNYCDGLW